MAEYKLKQKTKDYILDNYIGAGTSRVSGKNSYVLPYSLPKPTPVKVWTSNPAINGGIDYPNGIRTNAELAEALFGWYDKYGGLYKVDPNILMAQAMAESGLKLWNYAPTSTANGISQFTIITVYDYIITNRVKQFSDAERQAITKDIPDYTFASTGTQPKTPFYVKYDGGQINRQQMHQNVIDNPEILIKAQFIYMGRMADRCDGIASVALFAYNRGAKYLKGSSYALAVAAASKEPPDSRGNLYQTEGINYVHKIFKRLYDDFGYSELNMNESTATFEEKRAFLG